MSIIVVATTLAWAVAASAAGAAQVATTLTPDTVSAASSGSVAMTGLSGFSGLPSSIELLLQPGFTSSAMSVPLLCTAGQASSMACPSASQVGTAAAGVSFLGLPLTGSLTVYLGEPLIAGDIASVILSGSLDGVSLSLAGRLFVPPQGGLELLISGFPSDPVTLDSLYLTVQAMQTATHTVTVTVIKTTTVFTGKGKHRRKHKKKVKRKVKKTVRTEYSLITNPPTCTGGTWAGAVTLTYASGSNSLPFGIPCTTT
jgi:hypothetical protein